MAGTPTILHAVVSGLPLSGSDLNDNFYTVEQSFLGLGAYVVSGLVPSPGTGLSVGVTAGVAVIGASLSMPAFNIGGLAPGTLNYLYLQENGQGISNTTGTAPAASVALGTATTGATSTASVDITRASGRQQRILVQNEVHGGPGAGNPGSINLANWGAAAGNGITVYGTLPGGAVPAGSSTVLQLAQATKTVNYTLAGADFSIFADTTAGVLTMTLPTAVGNAGRVYSIKNIGTGVNQLTIATTGGQTIDGAAGASTTTPQATLILQSDGANWQAIGGG